MRQLLAKRASRRPPPGAARRVTPCRPAWGNVSGPRVQSKLDVGSELPRRGHPNERAATDRAPPRAGRESRRRDGTDRRARFSDSLGGLVGRGRAGCWVSAGVLALSGIVMSGIGLGWALFFSLGARGGSTAEMIRYNLAHPGLALIAYGPLGLGALLLFAAVALTLAGFARRMSSPRPPP